MPQSKLTTVFKKANLSNPTVLWSGSEWAVSNGHYALALGRVAGWSYPESAKHHPDGHDSKAAGTLIAEAVRATCRFNLEHAPSVLEDVTAWDRLEKDPQCPVVLTEWVRLSGKAPGRLAVALEDDKLHPVWISPNYVDLLGWTSSTQLWTSLPGSTALCDLQGALCMPTRGESCPVDLEQINVREALAKASR